MNTKTPNSQEPTQPGEAIADVIEDLRKLNSGLHSFPLSFTLVWRQHPDPQRQRFPTTSQPERTSQ